MTEPWEEAEPEAQWSDPEAWRGDEHPELPDDWCPDAGEGWVWAGNEEMPEDESDEPQGWPEELAGPEYWMYRRLDG